MGDEYMDPADALQFDVDDYAVPQEQKVAKKIGKVGKTEAKCHGCKAVKPMRDVYAGGDAKPYCLECYSKKFALGTCVECGEKVLGHLDDMYVKEAGLFWHKKCYKGTACDACMTVIFGDVLNALDLSFHPDCFKCIECKSLISGGFHKVDGRPVCMKCMKKKTDEAEKRNGRAPARPPKPVLIVEKGSVDQDGSKKMQETIDYGANCLRCGEVMNTNGHKTESGIYHEKCFVCDGCGENIKGGGDIVEKHDERYTRVFHADCARETLLPRCTKCAKPIEGQFLDLDGGQLHPECFTCHNCQVNLSGVAFTRINNLPHCKDCGQKKMQPKKMGGKKFKW